MLKSREDILEFLSISPPYHAGGTQIESKSRTESVQDVLKTIDRLLNITTAISKSPDGALETKLKKLAETGGG
jgi:hypothetical protein